MRLARGKSNPKAPLPSQQLEMETKKMEEKLAYLKTQMEVEKKKKEETQRTSGTRWKTSTAAQPIKNYATMIIDAKQQNDKTQKVDYAKLNKEYGEKIAQKSSLKNTSSSISTIKRPTSNSSTQRQKENQSSSELNKSLNGSFQQSSSKGMLERRNSRDVKQAKATLTPFLKVFLEELNLLKFTDAFLNNGYSTEDQVKELNNDTLTKMGIPPGFQIKIMKKVNALSLNTTQSEEKPLNNSIKKPSVTNITPRGKLQKPLLEQQKVNQQDQQTDSPNPLQQQDNNNNKNIATTKPPLLRKQPSQDLKKVRFTEKSEKSPQIQPKLKQSDDNSGKQLFHTESTATDAQTPSDFLLKKTSCWQCYSILPEEKSVFQYQKHFCKLECLDLYESYYMVQCSNSECKAKVSKQESSFIEEKWYCLGKCEPNMQEIEKMWEQQMTGDEKHDDESEEQYYERKIKEFEKIDKKRKEDYDLKLSVQNDKKSKVLTLEEIEAKYKLINEEQNIE